MEWGKQPNVQQVAEELNNGGIFVKVMTDEQIEILRKQIAAYAIICEQLVHLHKSFTLQNDLPGYGNLYYGPLMYPGGHRISARQRWTPTPVQLQILERTFDLGNGTPSKQRIKEITSELSQHGPISETNVYNWFQNRRARSKRKQQSAPLYSAEPEADTDVESQSEKTEKPQQHVPSSRSEDNPEFSSATHSMDPFRMRKPERILQPEDSLKRNGSSGQLPYGSMLSNPGVEHLIEKMEVPGSYSSYPQLDGFDPTG
uniref:WUSCHEL-related homeobox transcription factor 13 variant 2 n=1 Tax=Jasminum sambac TaxID=660624 RepID=A0A5P8HZX4_9LAMI|nr:WUSCHEL-related homeobox transcription factor 13 variant 2 [Jasminum sambac]